MWLMCQDSFFIPWFASLAQDTFDFVELLEMAIVCIMLVQLL